jgi:threonine synthase
MLQVLRESHGTAVAVDDTDLLRWTLVGSRLTGKLFCPEGGATLAALEQLHGSGWLQPTDRVVVFNTATGLKYPEVLARMVAEPTA